MPQKSERPDRHAQRQEKIEKAGEKAKEREQQMLRPQEAPSEKEKGKKAGVHTEEGRQFDTEG